MRSFLIFQIERIEQKKIASEVVNLLLFNMLTNRPLSLVMETIIWNVTDVNLWITVSMQHYLCINCN